MSGEPWIAATLPAWSAGLLSKAAVFSAAGLILAHLRRRASAAARHQMLALVAAAVLLLPLALLLVPEWNLGWTPISATRTASGTAGSAVAVTPETIASLPMALLAVWLVGSVVLLTMLTIGRLQGMAAARAARPPAGEHHGRLVAALCRRIGLERPVGILISKRVKVPVVLGWWSPRLILPESLTASSPASLEAILTHELAHVRRHDVLTQTLAQLMCCLYWPNPLAWMVMQRLLIERERACDDIVLASGTRASEYAKTLVDSAAALATSRNPIWVKAAMAEGTDFKDRVLSILDPSALRSVPSLSRTLASAVVVLLGTVLIAAAQPFGAAEPPTSSAASPIQPSPASRGGSPEEVLAAAELEPSPTDRSTSEDELTRASVGHLLDAIGGVIANSSTDAAREEAQAKTAQELMTSLADMVRASDDEPTARRAAAGFFASIGKLVLLDAPHEPDGKKPLGASEEKEGPRQER